MKDWQELHQELAEKRAKIHGGGGPKAVEKQLAQGKNTARQRLEMLLDPGSFVELNTFVKHRCTDLGMDKKETPGEGVVTGYGTIGGRLVYVFAQDFTVVGGSLGEMHARKICNVMDLAAKTGAPVIGLNDSGGARIQEGIDALNGYGEIFRRNTLYSGVLPQISVILGPCAGGAVYSPAITDFIFMTRDTSQMFITGPQVIKAVTGETISPEALGGGLAHNATSGVAHFLAEDEAECLNQVRRLISYLPANNLEKAPEVQPVPPREVDFTQLVPVNPNQGYDVREVIAAVFDGDSFMEVQAMFAPNAVVGFARLQGKTVGVVANQPQHLAGCLDINASDKIARFIRFCDCFNIPVVTFVDVPGYLPGVQQEHNGIIRHGAKILFAYSEASVPKVTVILRKAYGGAYVALGSKSLGADIVLAWPTAEVAVMGPEGAVNIIFRKELADAEDANARRQELVKEYRENFANPYVAAGRGLVDEVIEPASTRTHLINALTILAGKREQKPAKKHGNIPL
ncbi:MAG: methylmalonyl-CoA carboxyltransferase [Firmicutes bacterium]|nr:methylmalonyl-CoA carboxyltransferase [Bacillota bacterium]HPZ90058.1 carboxyl transferase domain-containing protein [Bacillota bacterium]HQE01004.1 carboxyl transferase domain-containing protein [Bacillota bacterium]